MTLEQKKLYEAVMVAVKNTEQQYAKYKNATVWYDQYWEWEKYLAALNYAKGLNEAYKLIYGTYVVDAIESIVWGTRRNW